jgi:hypothetical protein
VAAAVAPSSGTKVPSLIDQRPLLRAAAAAQVELTDADGSVTLTAAEAPELLADGTSAAAEAADAGDAAPDVLAGKLGSRMRITEPGARSFCALASPLFSRGVIFTGARELNFYPLACHFLAS